MRKEDEKFMEKLGSITGPDGIAMASYALAEDAIRMEALLPLLFFLFPKISLSKIYKYFIDETFAHLLL